jgi:hypothetical protein
MYGSGLISSGLNGAGGSAGSARSRRRAGADGTGRGPLSSWPSGIFARSLGSSLPSAAQRRAVRSVMVRVNRLPLGGAVQEFLISHLLRASGCGPVAARCSSARCTIPGRRWRSHRAVPLHRIQPGLPVMSGRASASALPIRWNCPASGVSVTGCKPGESLTMSRWAAAGANPRITPPLRNLVQGTGGARSASAAGSIRSSSGAPSATGQSGPRRRFLQRPAPASGPGQPPRPRPAAAAGQSTAVAAVVVGDRSRRATPHGADPASRRIRSAPDRPSRRRPPRQNGHRQPECLVECCWVSRRHATRSQGRRSCRAGRRGCAGVRTMTWRPFR